MSESIETTPNTEAPKKYVWILILVPLGLLIGAVTSTCNHILSDQEKNKGKDNQVSVDPMEESIASDMNVVHNYPTQDTTQVLRRISSALGIDSYLSIRNLNNGEGKAGYIDIEGDDKDEITAVVVELDQQDLTTHSAQIGLSVAVIKSILGEREFSHTIRFIFVPKTKKAKEHAKNVVVRGESLKSLYILRPSEISSAKGEKVMWKVKRAPSLEKAQILSHPAFDLGRDDVSPELVALTLRASKDLREILVQSFK